MRSWRSMTSPPSTGSTCAPGSRSIQKHLRHRAAPHDPVERLPLQQDRARHGLQAVEAAQKSWRRLDGHNQLPKVIQGVKFTDGIEVAAKQATPQARNPPPDPSGRHQDFATACTTVVGSTRHSVI